MMDKNRVKRWVVNAGKVSASALAIGYVLSKIDVSQLADMLRNASLFPLLLAALFFIASKVISALRLNIYFKNVDVQISHCDNYKLYLLGMFYNLFLPGGIGGDGYKVWLLHRRLGASVKRVAAAVFLDRVNGMYAILILTFLAVPFLKFQVAIQVISLFVLIVSPFAYFVLVKKLFSYFLNTIKRTTLLSLLVQLLQVVCVVFILYSVGIDANYLELIFIFLLSSAVAVLPFTIGGIGARELVFLYGSLWWGLSSSESIAVSLLFFVISAVVSLLGIYYSFKKIDFTPINSDEYAG